MADKLILLVAGLLVVAGIGGFYQFADQPQLYRVLGLLAVLGVATVIALQSSPGKAAWEFGRSAILEVRKAVWPTRQETVQTTLLVLAMVVIVGLMLWLFDLLMNWAVRLLLGLGG